jgi:CheY-like chemotaxis protein
VFLMELRGWQTVLDAFQSLLEAYRGKNLPWDERIADVTSEIIEKEDLLISGGGASNLEDTVSDEELRALSQEVDELLKFAAETPAQAARGTGPAAGQADGASNGTKTEHPGSGGRKLIEKSMAELRRQADALDGAWASASTDTEGTGASSPSLEDIRARLLVIGFHAFSMERVVGGATSQQSAPFVDAPGALRVAIEDHAAAVAVPRGRSIEVAFSGENVSFDARLLQPAYIILQHLVSDVLLRCGREDLRLEIAVENKDGACLWTLRDNGENFVSDSHVDRDEYLAFYPGLREARKILGDLHTLLWVEPDGRAGTRFSFTMPPTLQDRTFMVWKNAGVAVLSSELSGVYRADEIEIASDSHGERVAADGRWVPLIRLGQVYPEGSSDGDRIAVIGSLEKRVAFYVEGEGSLEKGIWKKDGGAAAKGMDGGVARIGDARIPLVEANGLLQKYMAIVGVAPEERVSGGVDDVVSDSSHTQAKREKDAKTPPENSCAKDEVDVLVVEENDSLSAKTVGGLDDALAFLETGEPAVVISDFRVPTMAAKTIADRLRKEGKKIPVFVTTTHTGKNAEVLVKRLGVSGYIAKPVKGDDVVESVAPCVAKRAGRNARRATRLAI